MDGYDGEAGDLHDGAPTPPSEPAEWGRRAARRTCCNFLIIYDLPLFFISISMSPLVVGAIVEAS